MKEDANTLDEVVVTGYGDFKKATYTGSASVLTTEKLEALPVVSVGQMIESNIPGISVVAGTSSQPGAKTTLRVRGNRFYECFHRASVCIRWSAYSIL